MAPRPAAKTTKAAKTPAKAASRSTPSEFPERIFAIASPRSLGGVSMLEAGAMADSSTVGQFASDTEAVTRAVHLLADAGFEVLQATSLMINIAGPRSLYESAFNTTLVAEARTTMKSGGVEGEATFIDSVDTEISGLIRMGGTRFDEVLEGVAIEEPRYRDAANAFAPPVKYWHLDVPGDVSLGCNADKAHRAGVTGRGVVVAMVDTGWEAHPWFTSRGYRVDPTVLGPGTADPGDDGHGHGTGESANIFSTAPDVLLKPVKAATATGALVNTTAAVNAAVALGPDIITNSWGGSVPNGPLSAAQQAQAAAVAAAVASGIIVVFSAGNGSWGCPAQHPDVISVGGVYVTQDGAMRASDYSSGFMSNVYAGRRVPDVSGLVGMQPGANYIMLPVPPGCVIDVGKAGGTHPNGDETAADDGWAAFSGTSASAPQVAGVCALILQACPHLTPAQVRNILMQTARDVTTGTNALGNTATVGPDTATGNGLVDADRAVLLAKLRCLVVPVQPVVPFPPLLPFQPPVLPFQPPLQPVQPLRPVFPAIPVQPLMPIRPLQPIGPRPGPLSAEDIAALEGLILSSENPPEL